MNLSSGATIPARVHSSLAAQSVRKRVLRMNRYDLLHAAIAAMLVAGCASVAPQTDEPQRDKTHVTGSRLPARDGGTSANVKSISNKEDIDDVMQRGSVIAPPGGGN